MLVDNNLAAAIYRHALTTPDAPAVVDTRKTYSYRQLAGRAAAIAATLQATAGWPAQRTGALPRVGILASRSVDACAALLGTCWAGATYVPINLKLPPERLAALLRQCELHALICDDQGARLLDESCRAAAPRHLLHAGSPELAPAGARLPEDGTAPRTPPAALAGDDLAYIIFTSGTTGQPKGVMIPTAAARHYATQIAAHLGLRADDRALESCDLSFDFSVHNMFSTWEAGAALHILPANQAMNAVKFVRNSRLTVWNSVPSLAGLLRQVKALAPNSLDSLRLTVFGGEQLPAPTVDAWRAAAPHSAIHNLYGPTEATVFCLAQAVHSPTPLTPGRAVVAIGQPLPGCTARIIDESGREVAVDTPGELAIGGCQLATGYFGAPPLSAERFPVLDGERWYRTGDLALRDADGNFHCLGRLDNQVKILGYRVELEEIDAHLRAATGVDLVGSLPWPLDGDTARGVVGFIAHAGIDTQPVIAALKQRLAPYMVPSRIIALPDMPLNASGKVDRRALRRHLEDGGQ